MARNDARGHRNPMPGERLGQKATMLSKVLHILPRPFLDRLALVHDIPAPHTLARQFLEMRLIHAATPRMREEIAHYLHGELCPTCVLRDTVHHEST